MDEDENIGPWKNVVLSDLGMPDMSDTREDIQSDGFWADACETYEGDREPSTLYSLASGDISPQMLTYQTGSSDVLELDSDILGDSLVLDEISFEEDEKKSKKRTMLIIIIVIILLLLLCLGITLGVVLPRRTNPTVIVNDVLIKSVVGGTSLSFEDTRYFNTVDIELDCIGCDICTINKEITQGGQAVSELVNGEEYTITITVDCPGSDAITMSLDATYICEMPEIVFEPDRKYVTQDLRFRIEHVLEPVSIAVIDGTEMKELDPVLASGEQYYEYFTEREGRLEVVVKMEDTRYQNTAALDVEVWYAPVGSGPTVEVIDIRTIDSRAFRNVADVEKIVIHQVTSNIPQDAFSDLLSLKYIGVDENNTTFKTHEGALMLNKALYRVPIGMEQITIDDKIDDIKQGAFVGYKGRIVTTRPNDIVPVIHFGDSEPSDLQGDGSVRTYTIGTKIELILGEGKDNIKSFEVDENRQPINGGMIIPGKTSVKVQAFYQEGNEIIPINDTIAYDLSSGNMLPSFPNTIHRLEKWAVSCVGCENISIEVGDTGSGDKIKPIAGKDNTYQWLEVGEYDVTVTSTNGSSHGTVKVIEWSCKAPPIVVPDYLDKLTAAALKRCLDAVSITIPGTLKQIEKDALGDLLNLQTIKASGNFIVDSSTLLDNGKKRVIKLIPNSYDKLTILDGVVEIDKTAMNGSEVNTLVIPNTLTVLPDNLPESLETKSPLKLYAVQNEKKLESNINGTYATDGVATFTIDIENDGALSNELFASVYTNFRLNDMLTETLKLVEQETTIDFDIIAFIAGCPFNPPTEYRGIWVDFDIDVDASFVQAGKEITIKDLISGIKKITKDSVDITAECGSNMKECTLTFGETDNTITITDNAGNEKTLTVVNQTCPLVDGKTPSFWQTLKNEYLVGCPNIESITITSNIEDIEDEALNIDGLEEIKLENESHFKLYDGCLYTNDFLTLIKCPALISPKSGTYNIHSSTTTIRKNAFYKCDNIGTVILPTSINDIVCGAFNKYGGQLGDPGASIYDVQHGDTSLSDSWHNASNGCLQVQYKVTFQSMNDIQNKIIALDDSNNFTECISGERDITLHAFLCDGNNKVPFDSKGSVHVKIDPSVDAQLPGTIDVCVPFEFVDTLSGIKGIEVRPNGNLSVSGTMYKYENGELTIYVSGPVILTVTDNAENSITQNITVKDWICSNSGSVPEGLLNIANVAHACKSITTLTIPKSVEYIETGSFDGMKSLTAFISEGTYKGSGLLYKGSDLFRVPPGLRGEHIITDGTKVILPGAMKDCELTLVIPNSLEAINIRNETLSDELRLKTKANLSLETIIGGEIFNTINWINGNMVDKEERLMAVTLAENELGIINSMYVYQQGSSNPVAGLVTIPIQGTGDITIGFDVYYCAGIQRIKFENTIEQTYKVDLSILLKPESIMAGVETTITDSISGLTSLEFFGDTLSRNGDYNVTFWKGGEYTVSAQDAAGNSENVTITVNEWKCEKNSEIPEGLLILAENAFDECPTIETICMPASITEIKGDPFSKLKNLNSFTSDEGNANYFAFENILYHVDGRVIRHPIGYNEERHILWEGTTTITANAYAGTSVQEIELNENLGIIEDNALDFNENVKLIYKGGKMTTDPEPYSKVESWMYCEEMVEITYQLGIPLTVNAQINDSTDNKVNIKNAFEINATYQYGERKIPVIIEDLPALKLDEEVDWKAPNEMKVDVSYNIRDQCGVKDLIINDENVTSTHCEQNVCNVTFNESGEYKITVIDNLENEENYDVIVTNVATDCTLNDAHVTNAIVMEYLYGCTEITIDQNVETIDDDAFCGMTEINNITIKNDNFMLDSRNQFLMDDRKKIYISIGDITELILEGNDTYTAVPCAFQQCQKLSYIVLTTNNTGTHPEDWEFPNHGTDGWCVPTIRVANLAAPEIIPQAHVSKPNMDLPIIVWNPNKQEDPNKQELELENNGNYIRCFPSGNRTNIYTCTVSTTLGDMTLSWNGTFDTIHVIKENYQILGDTLEYAYGVGTVSTSPDGTYKNIIFPTTVITIKNTVANNSLFPEEGLTRVTFTECSKITEIGNYVFYQNNALSSISFPKSLKIIGDFVFSYTNVKSIVIPPTLTTIGKNPFEEFNKIQVAEGNQSYAMYDGALYTKNMSEIIAVENWREGDTLRIPDGTKTIRSYFISRSSPIRYLYVPASIKTLKGHAFSNTNLEYLCMPSNIDSISTPLFDNSKIKNACLYNHFLFSNIKSRLPSSCQVKTTYDNTCSC